MLKSLIELLYFDHQNTDLNKKRSLPTYFKQHFINTFVGIYLNQFFRKV